MGFWGAIGGFINGCCSAAVGLCSSIGGAVMKGISAMAPALSKALSIGESIVSAVSFLAEVFAGKPEEEQPMDIGYKADIAAEEYGKKPDDFDSIGKYLEYLRKDIEVDHEKMEKISDIDKGKYTVMGMGLYLKDIEEKNDMTMGTDFVGAAGKALKKGYTKEDIAGLVKDMKGKGVDNMDAFADYLKGDLQPGSSELRAVYGAVKDMVEKHFVGTEADIREKMDDLKDGEKK